MNRIDARFAELKERGEKALIPFLTVGDPDVATTVEIILQMEEAGADIVELGVPYSDPLADGPVIQRSSQRALSRNRITIMDCIRTAKACRDRGSRLPFILFTYYNPVLQMGLERFMQTIVEHDISGLIIPDLPVEESGPIRELASANGVHLIPLIAPTSRERIQKIVDQASGFLYCVSSLGVTGTRSEFYTGLNAFIDSVKQSTDLPVAIGFGISNREQAVQMAEISDAIVVGSAIVRQIEQVEQLLGQPASRQEGLLQIRDFVRQLKA